MYLCTYALWDYYFWYSTSNQRCFCLVFSFNLFWSKFWCYSVMAVEKLHHQHVDSFPNKTCYYYAIQPAHKLDFSRKKGIKAQRKCVRHHASKTGRDIIIHSHCLQVTVEQLELTVETLHCKRQRIPLMEEAKRVKRESDVNWSKTRVNGQAFSQSRAHRCCVKVCYPADMCLPLLPEHETVQNCNSFHQNSKTQNLPTSFQSFISQAVRGSHVAKALQQQEYHLETLGGGEV